MNAVEPAPLDEKTPPSPNSSDEKRPSDPEKTQYHDLVHQVSTFDDIGDVYENTRVIDLGEDGKERSFETAADWSLRLVSLEDDPSQPVWTFRLWLIAIGLSCFGAVLSQIFFFRPTTIYVSQLFLQTFAFILGKILERFLPGPGNTHPFLKTKDTAFWRFVNPGPFNLKEHVGTLIMGAAATHGALAISIFAADELFYNYKANVAISIFTLLGSQLMGYGLAGMMRSFLVYPTQMMFPNLMPTIQMFDVLHRGQGNFLQAKRVKFFWALFIGIFFWEWLPEYIAPTLTGVSIFCLANQKSAWFTRIFGGAAGNEGLGMFALSFDWNYVGSGGSAYGALFQPLATQMNMYFGILICILSFCLAFHQNAWNAQRFPFLTQLLFNEDGSQYNQTLILNDDFTLNPQKLEQQGLPWFATSQAINKVGTSLAFGATVTHITLWYGKDLWRAVKASRNGAIDDPHYKKMQVYPEVPIWWWAGIFAVSVAMGMATNYTSHSQLPWWAYLIAVGFAVVFLPIITALYAIICFVPNTQDIARMLGAALIKGKPHANMYFTLYAYNVTEQGRSMARDLKMGQYTKLPPRVTFTMQCVGAVIGALLNLVVMRVVIESNRDILLSVQGTNVWSGAAVQAFNSDAITWGALAEHLYAPNTRYGIVPLSILIGLLLPVPFWLFHRRYTRFGFDSVITPMICTYVGGLNVGINSAIFTTFMLAVFSQYYLRKYRPRWFRKYNFLVSAALDGGTEVMVFVYSFAFGGAGGRVIDFPRWALNPRGNPDHCLRLT